MLYGLGTVVVIIGICFKLFPPKSIYCFYAHKTKLARVNDDTWQEAQKFGMYSMISAGLLMIASGGVLYGLVGMSDATDHTAVVLVVFVLMIGMMAANEMHLKKIFNDDGTRKSSV